MSRDYALADFMRGWADSELRAQRLELERQEAIEATAIPCPSCGAPMGAMCFETANHAGRTIKYWDMRVRARNQEQARCEDAAAQTQ